MTLGFDPQKGGYVGTWIGSMTSFLWIYRGTLDRAEKILTLDTEGPNFDGEGLARSWPFVNSLHRGIDPFPWRPILPVAKVVYLSEDRRRRGGNSGAASDLKSRWLQSDDAKQRGNSDCEDENYLNHEGLPVVLCSRLA